jgi:hypothetical protein
LRAALIGPGPQAGAPARRPEQRNPGRADARTENGRRCTRRQYRPAADSVAHPSFIPGVELPPSVVFPM